MATASYEDALRHVQTRRQFGRELADFQGLQWMLADMAIQLNACRAVLYQAAEALDDDGELDPLQVSMAKVFVAETCVRVCDMAIQLFGGYGYMAESPVNLALPPRARHRDLRRHDADPPQHDRRARPGPTQPAAQSIHLSQALPFRAKHVLPTEALSFRANTVIPSKALPSQVPPCHSERSRGISLLRTTLVQRRRSWRDPSQARDDTLMMVVRAGG